MKKEICSLILFVFCLEASIAQKGISIIPLPNQYMKTSGMFYLSRQTSIKINDTIFSGAKYLLQNQLLKYTGVTLLQKGGNNSITMEKNNLMEKNGVYRIDMNPRGIILSSANEEGMRNAVSTLIQLVILSKKNDGVIVIENWSISDKPLYNWRGIMLDESRHFFGKKEVEKILDQMFLLKLNKFHWHLTDVPGWRIEIKKYPKLTLIGGIGNYTDSLARQRYYTQEDIREIVTFAAERGIEIIPELDMPGHATAANRAYPEYSGGWAKQNLNFTFNPGINDTYSYLTNILKEFATLFPSKKIHLGGDEVSFGIEAWNSSNEVRDLMKKQKLKSLKDVEHYFLKRMSDSALHLFDNILAWDEAVDSDIPADKTIIYWWRHNKPKQLNRAIEKGFKVVLSPRIPLYWDFVQDSSHIVGRKWNTEFSSLKQVYSFSLSTYSNAPGLAESILGMQANLWTETVQSKERLEFLLFPRMAAFSETVWTTVKNKNYDRFLEQLPTQLEYYKKEGIYYFDPFHPEETPEIIH